MPVVLGLSLLCLLFFLCSRDGVADPDIWWHLRNASQLIHTRHFIQTDSWTFTVAGKPWINFEWLAEVPYYFAYRWLGDRGLYLVMMLAAGAIVVGVYCLGWMRSRECTAGFVASLVAVLFTTVSLAPRPLLFGWLFLVLELCILWQLREGRDHTAWLPLLFLVWINAHGSWFLGFGLMLLFFSCGLVEGEWGNLYAKRWTPRQARRLLAVTAIGFAALFINPYGWRLVAYPVDALIHQKLGMQYIAEWASLDFHTERGKVVLATFLLLGILQLVRRRRWPLEDLVFALIAVYGAVTYVRFVFLAGILLTPILAMDLGNTLLKPYDATRDRAGPNAAALAVLLAVIVAVVPTEKQLQAGIRAEFPEKVIPYVRNLARRGHVFEEYDWGGYLEWEAPQVQEFIDPRADIFVQEGMMGDYARATKAEGTFEVMDEYQIRYAVLAKGDPAAYVLEHSPDWKPTYDDGQAVVLERIH